MGEKQRIFQVLACGVEQAGERTGRRGVPKGGCWFSAALPPLGPVRSARSVDDGLRCGGSLDLLLSWTVPTFACIRL